MNSGDTDIKKGYRKISVLFKERWKFYSDFNDYVACKLFDYQGNNGLVMWTNTWYLPETIVCVQDVHIQSLTMSVSIKNTQIKYCSTFDCYVGYLTCQITYRQVNGIFIGDGVCVGPTSSDTTLHKYYYWEEGQMPL